MTEVLRTRRDLVLFRPRVSLDLGKGGSRAEFVDLLGNTTLFELLGNGLVNILDSFTAGLGKTSECVGHSVSHHIILFLDGFKYLVHPIGIPPNIVLTNPSIIRMILGLYTNNIISLFINTKNITKAVESKVSVGKPNVVANLRRSMNHTPLFINYNFGLVRNSSLSNRNGRNGLLLGSRNGLHMREGIVELIVEVALVAEGLLGEAHSKCLLVIPVIAGLTVNGSDGAILPSDSKHVLRTVGLDCLDLKRDDRGSFSERDFHSTRNYISIFANGIGTTHKSIITFRNNFQLIAIEVFYKSVHIKSPFILSFIL